MREMANAVRFKSVATLPAEFVTLLAPIAKLSVDADAQARLTHVAASPGISAYRFVDHQEEHRFIFAQNTSWKFHDWESDAEFMYSCSTDGKLNLLVFCNGTHLDICGDRIISSPKRILRCELIHSHGQTQVICSEDDILMSQDGISKSFEAGETLCRGTDEAAH